MTKIETPESSNIEWFKHNDDKTKLSVCFKGGKVFRYKGLNADVIDGMVAAPSRGSYFAKHIKGKFDAVIEEDFI